MCFLSKLNFPLATKRKLQIVVRIDVTYFSLQPVTVKNAIEAFSFLAFVPILWTFVTNKNLEWLLYIICISLCNCLSLVDLL